MSPTSPRAEPVSDQLRVAVRTLQDGVVELRIDGILDWSNFVKVEEAMSGIFEREVFKIVVNLEGAKHISSTGFGCFISSLDTAMNNGGQIVFCGTPPHILGVFDTLGLSKILTFAATPGEALKMF